MSNVAADNAAKLREMISGHMLSQILSATAMLGLADLLAAGKASGKALAEATGTHSAILAAPAARPGRLRPARRNEPGCFRLTALGALLRTDVPGSLRNLALMHVARPVWRAWGDLLHAVRTGQTAFEHVFGMGSFQYASLHPDRAAIFDDYMAD